MKITRREVLKTAVQASAIAAAARFTIIESFAQTSGRYSPLFNPLDDFVRDYMQSMNAPGMTLVLADRDGVQRIATYGFTDRETKAAVEPNQLFEIGSISKSFLALVLLQLYDEGKLDLHKPVTDYLPWWKIDARFGPISTHHLLTHSSGLDSGPVFLSDPAAKHRAAYAPGKHFHYNNMAFATMGHLVETLDGQPFSVAVKKRIFDPLGMNASAPVITFDVRERMAKSWWAFMQDRPYPRNGRLAEAPHIVMTDASGCIASTPQDMGLYIQALANGGRARERRLVSEESFAMFGKPWIKAEEFGPTASYGYGIAVDKLDGHTVLRHTGGMVSFASSMQVDIDEGVGVFASINAMQGYRPNPVAQYAIQSMRAVREGKALPKTPELKPATFVENAADFAGSFTSNGKAADGRTLLFRANGQTLSLVAGNSNVALENAGEGRFVVPSAPLDRYTLAFARADGKDPKSPVVSVGWGSEWFVNEKYRGPALFDHPKEWDAYLGHYRNESSWNGSIRVVLRKGTLMLDGVVPLEAAPDGVFMLRDEESNTEWVKFFDIVNGKAMRLTLSGDDFWRVDAE